MTLSTWQRHAEIVCRRAPNSSRLHWLERDREMYAIIMMVDRVVMDRMGERLVRDTVAIVPTHQIGELVRGTPLVADRGTEREQRYIVRDIRQETDEFLTELTLARDES